jgi:phosphoribosylformylglycinamidine synthase
MVGLIPDLTKICGQGWQAEDDLIYLLGVPLDAEPSPIVTLGGSEYLAAVQNAIAGQPPIVDFALERRVQAACREGIRQGWVRSAHDSAEGGVAVAIAESCISGNLGATLTFPPAPRRLDHLLFAEGGARIIISVARSQQSQWEAYLQTHLDTAWQALGVVSSYAAGLTLTAPDQPLIKLGIDTLSDRWQGAIASHFAD